MLGTTQLFGRLRAFRLATEGHEARASQWLCKLRRRRLREWQQRLLLRVLLWARLCPPYRAATGGVGKAQRDAARWRGNNPAAAQRHRLLSEPWADRPRRRWRSERWRGRRGHANDDAGGQGELRGLLRGLLRGGSERKLEGRG